MSDVVLIFSHYGYSAYLEYSLACARKTNPDARLILLGDKFNADVAKRHGWEHYLFESFESEFHPRFLKVFRHIQGVKHDPTRNGRDWLKYVFERWLFIDAFITSRSIDRFWHFDSDTMVLQDLRQYETDLVWADFSVQCNNTCLNGIVSSDVVSEYCEHICSLFEDIEFLSEQQLEFDTVNTNFAFTEMRAFDHYKKQTVRPWVHLLTYKENVVFDDCICQEHGFQMCTLQSGEIVKKLFAISGKIYGIRDGSRVEFITLNLSWVPDYVFNWVLNVTLRKIDTMIEDVDCPTWLRIVILVKNVKRLLVNVFR